MSTSAFLVMGLVASVTVVRAASPEEPPPLERATLRARVDGALVDLPTLALDVRADVEGDLATCTLVQRFGNPATHPVDATYLFPLPADAAVDRMEVRVGDERLRATIRRRDEAKRTFEAARDEGRSAALVEQVRPGTYSQSIANLMPGGDVEVTLRWVQALPRRDGAYELVVPLVVGPWWAPASPPAPQGDVQADLRAPVPPAPHGGDPGERVHVAIRLAAGSPLGAIESRTHQLVITRTSTTEALVTLSPTKDDRDLVVRYRLAGDGVQAGGLGASNGKEGVVSLLVEPPAKLDERTVAPREVVFVLDCSGSMEGSPLDAAKAFVVRALDRLRPADSFRVIRFSDRATEYSASPLPADPQHVAGAKRLVDAVTSEGGTDMSSGIHQALSVPAPAGVLRVVVFLTDGFIGDDRDVLALVHAELGEARLFPVGVGTATNRALLDEMGRIGRGTTRYLDPTDDVAAQVEALSDRIEAPVLTDVRVDWGDLAPSEVVPAHVPDLFAGSSLRVIARTKASSGTHHVEVTGLSAGERVRLPFDVVVGSGEARAHALTSAWARARVAEALGVLEVPEESREERVTDDALRERVTELGLAQSIVTPWTSFVAVSEQVVNDDRASTAPTAVPLPLPAGMKEAAEPAPPLFATPEPTFLTSLLVAVAALGVAAAASRRFGASA